MNNRLKRCVDRAGLWIVLAVAIALVGVLAFQSTVTVTAEKSAASEVKSFLAKVLQITTQGKQKKC